MEKKLLSVPEDILAKWKAQAKKEFMSLNKWIIKEVEKNGR